jgi:hypothetical protein
MTETISTPGVYTSEVNQSFIAPIQIPDGCAIIGPTQKGEAYVPTSIQSPGQFSAVFGTDTSNSYVPQTAYNYLQAGTSINVTRVLGNGGWGFTPAKSLAAIVQPAVSASVGLKAYTAIPTASLVSSLSGSGQQVITIAGASTQYFYGYNPAPVVISGSVVVDVPASTTLYVNGTGNIGSNIILTLNDPQSGSTVLGSYTQTTALAATDLVSAINTTLANNSLAYTSSITGTNSLTVTAPAGKGAALNGTSITFSSVAETRASGSFAIPASPNGRMTLYDLTNRQLAVNFDMTGLTQAQAGASLSTIVSTKSVYSASYSTGTLTLFAPKGKGSSGNSISIYSHNSTSGTTRLTLSGGSNGTYGEIQAIGYTFGTNFPFYVPDSYGNYTIASIAIINSKNKVLANLGSYQIQSSDTTSATAVANFIANVNSNGNQGFTLSTSDGGYTIDMLFPTGYGASGNDYYPQLTYKTYDSSGNSRGWGSQGANNFQYGLDAAPQLPITTIPFTGGVTANTGSYQIIYGNSGTQALGANYFVNTGSQLSQFNNLVSLINGYSTLTGITGSLSGSNVILTSIYTGSIYNGYYAGPAPTSTGVVNPVSQSVLVGGTDTVTAVPGGVIAVLHPSLNKYPNLASLNNSSIGGSSNSSLGLTIAGNQVQQTANVSMYNTDPNYYANVLGTNAAASTGGAFAYLSFQSASLSDTTPVTLILQSGKCTFTSSNAEGYDYAETPWVVDNNNNRLFQFAHRAQGFSGNTDVKVAIANITVNPDPTVYTKFDVLVRQYSDTDKTPVILEQYTGVTLNPNDANYIGTAIGDRYNYYDSVSNKVVSEGDFDNVSNYIRVIVGDAVISENIPNNVVINGNEPLFETFAGFGSLYHLPQATYVVSNSGSYIYSGFDFTNPDNANYLNPIPLEAGYGNNIQFAIPAGDNKFILPFQGGTDGMSYQTIKNIGANISTDGTNVFGFDLSSNQTAGYAAFAQAINILSNTQLYKYGILVMPGIINQYHGAVTEYAQSMVEQRGDAVYLSDLTGVNEGVNTAVEVASGLNSTYGATYYPWVKVRDIGSSKNIYVPPTVLVPQAIAYTDTNAAPWFAVAGTGRGTLGGAIDTKNRLSTTEQGLLYNANINPIIKTPNTGVVIWGQKTLSKQNTALNRLNVRRLLIALKDYISNIANDFVFEQNSNATRASFLNKINPYLQNVQQNQGITAFKTTCDATNNTDSDVANHILNCKIQIVPTMSIEFILLEFDITPQGVTFS